MFLLFFNEKIAFSLLEMEGFNFFSESVFISFHYWVRILCIGRSYWLAYAIRTGLVFNRTFKFSGLKEMIPFLVFFINAAIHSIRMLQQDLNPERDL